MKIDILLVEDCQEDAELAIKVLRQDNPSVRLKVISDGADALGYLFDEDENVYKSRLPRVIFLDIKLPRITGSEVLIRLKSHETTRNIPVVVLTSSSQQKDIFECYEFGANSYLVKPIDYQDYHAMIVNSSRYWLQYNTPMHI